MNSILKKIFIFCQFGRRAPMIFVLPVWPQEHLPSGDVNEIHILGRVFLAHCYAENVMHIMGIMLRPHFRTLHFF